MSLSLSMVTTFSSSPSSLLLLPLYLLSFLFLFLLLLFSLFFLLLPPPPLLPSLTPLFQSPPSFLLLLFLLSFLFLLLLLFLFFLLPPPPSSSSSSSFPPLSSVYRYSLSLFLTIKLSLGLCKIFCLKYLVYKLLFSWCCRVHFCQNMSLILSLLLNIITENINYDSYSEPGQQLHQLLFSVFS